jgi:predicted transposase/invertase (TIGR01784 family)
MSMLFVEYDPVEARKVAIEEGFEDGLEKGRSEGRSEERTEIILNMKQNGYSAGEIAGYTGISEEQVARIYSGTHTD